MNEKEIILSDADHKLLKKVILTPGEFSIFPVEGSKCQVEITEVSCRNEFGNCEEDSVYLGETFNGALSIGEAAHFIDIDLERCLLRMTLEEFSCVTISYHKKSGEKALEVSCKIKLLKVEDPGLFCDWHWAKKITHSNRHKEVGVKLISEGKTVDAFRQFSKALKYILSLDTVDYEAIEEDDKCKIVDLKVKLYNNLAFCQLQHNEYAAVLMLCNKVLEEDSGNVKALYRRGSARMGLMEWEAAYEDMRLVLIAQPGDAAALQKAAVLRDKIKHINENYKKMVKNMFA